jgi:hypothetical protein
MNGKITRLLNLRADELNKPHYGGALGQDREWRSLDYSDVQHLITKDELRQAAFNEPINIVEGAGPMHMYFPSIRT